MRDRRYASQRAYRRNRALIVTLVLGVVVSFFVGWWLGDRDVRTLEEIMQAEQAPDTESTIERERKKIIDELWKMEAAEGNR